jgi:AcrR family transcriptional regulator
MNRVMRTSTVTQRPLRERLMEQTREAILDGLGEQLAESGLRDFSIPKVAKRAGVSVRTVYRYFPTREALLDSLDDWVNRRLGHPDFPATPDEAAAVAADMFPRFADNAAMLQAQIQSTAGRELKLHARRSRARQFEKLLATETRHLPPDDAKEAAAIFYLLCSSTTWQFLHDVWGFDAAQAARAATRAQKTLLADLRRNKGRDK